MEVIRHDDKVDQRMFLTVGVFQAQAYDLREQQLPQDTGAVALI